jgi:hypothetical protein
VASSGSTTAPDAGAPNAPVAGVDVGAGTGTGRAGAVGAGVGDCPEACAQNTAKAVMARMETARGVVIFMAAAKGSRRRGILACDEPAARP